MSASVKIDFKVGDPAAVAASLRRIVAMAKAASPCVADLRRIAKTIDSPDDPPAALICRAAHALRDHLAAAPVEASLRALGWCDVDVRETGAALKQATESLRAAE